MISRRENMFKTLNKVTIYALGAVFVSGVLLAYDYVYRLRLLLSLGLLFGSASLALSTCLHMGQKHLEKQFDEKARKKAQKKVEEKERRNQSLAKTAEKVKEKIEFLLKKQEKDRTEEVKSKDHNNTDLSSSAHHGETSQTTKIDQEDQQIGGKAKEGKSSSTKGKAVTGSNDQLYKKSQRKRR